MPGKPIFSNPRKRYHRFDILLVDDSTVNTFGESTEALPVLATLWGSLEPRSGREYWLASQLQAETTHIVTFLYLPSIAGQYTAKCKLRKGTRIFEHTRPPINVEERNREWFVEVKEKGTT